MDMTSAEKQHADHQLVINVWYRTGNRMMQNLGKKTERVLHRLGTFRHERRKLCYILHSKRREKGYIKRTSVLYL